MVQAQVATLTNAILYRNDGYLIKAKEEIDKACVNEKTISMSKTWFYKGIIYMELYKASSEEAKATDYMSLTEAANAFKKAVDLDKPHNSINDSFAFLLNSAGGFSRSTAFLNALAASVKDV